MADSTRLFVDETTAPVLEPGQGKTKTGYLWPVLRDDRGWGGTAPRDVAFHYRPRHCGEYAAEILDGFNGTIKVPSALMADTPGTTAQYKPSISTGKRRTGFGSTSRLFLFSGAESIALRR